MNKLEVLVQLADRLSVWPSTIQSSPMVDGWTWVEDLANKAIVLSLNITFERPQIITEGEWSMERSTAPAEQKKPVPVEVMVDIETFDTESSAIMFQAAQTFFDKDHNVVYKETWNLKFDEQLAAGRTVSGGTIAFHLGLPANAKAALGDKEAVTMCEFAKQLVTNYKIFKPKLSWAKGDFDFKIIASIFAHLGMDVPWKFYQLRELRTLMSECDVKKGIVSHTALEDCVAQLAQLAECRGNIRYGALAYTQMQARDKEDLLAAPSNDELKRDHGAEVVLEEVAPTCLYSVDQGVTDALPDERVAYRADCGYQKMVVDGYHRFPEGTCSKCKREITLAKDPLAAPIDGSDNRGPQD